jgi:predicted amidohydrolase
MTGAPILRLAVAQTEVSGDVPTSEVIAAAGIRVRSQMAQAAQAEARIVQFPEGTLSYPSKKLISTDCPQVGEADWTKLDWDALRDELASIADAADLLGVWTVVGAPHRLSDGRRPHNSLYVFSDRGELVTRYDKRCLSTTEIAHFYTPGTDAVVFDVDGFRFGNALCLEILFPELFVDYAAMDVDAVLVSSAPSPAFGLLAHAHAVMNAITVSLAVAAGADTEVAPSGICAPRGWLARCTNGQPGVTITDIQRHERKPSFQRQARAGLYDAHRAQNDPRSLDRQSL